MCLTQKSINLSRLLTSGQQEKTQNIKKLTDAPKPSKKNNHRKKLLKALADKERVTDELIPIDNDILPKSEDLQLVPYTIEMMSLVDQSQNLASESNTNGRTINI